MTRLIKYLDAFPPYLVRLQAKNNGKLLSDAEIAIVSGIDINRIREIKLMTDWNMILFGEIVRYTTGCNFDPTSSRDRKRARDCNYQCQKRNSQTFSYLRRSPKFESEILPVLQMIQNRLTQHSNAA